MGRLFSNDGSRPVAATAVPPAGPASTAALNSLKAAAAGVPATTQPATASGPTTPTTIDCGSADLPVPSHYEVRGISCSDAAGVVGSIYAGDAADGPCTTPYSTAADGSQTFHCPVDGGGLIVATLGTEEGGSTGGADTSSVTDSSGGSPTLGVVWASNQKGYGTVRPSIIFNGGDPTGLVQNITWSSWGGEQGIGSGTAEYVAPNEAVYQGHDEPATVVAFDLGSCAGAQRYGRVSWYFPQHGESFDPKRNHYDLCVPAP